MDDELRQALEAMERRINTRFDEVNTRFEQIDTRFEQVDSRFKQINEEINTRFDEVYERIHDVETHLLRAFKGWADSVDMRIKGFSTFDERLAILERRMTELELRRQPPQ